MPKIAGPNLFDLQRYQMVIHSELAESTQSTANGGSTSVGSEAGFFETRTLTTGTSTNGAAAIDYENMRFANGEVWKQFAVKIQDLATASEDYILEVGSHNGRAATAITDGCFFRYDRSTSTNWYAVSENTSTETTTDTGVAATTNATFLQIYFNSDYTSVEYYIDDALVATHTTNLPGSSTATRFAWLVVKTAGTTSRNIICCASSGIIKR